jgi:hypothetical protein
MTSHFEISATGAALLAVAVALILVVYIFFFIFLHGSPNKGTSHDKWIR